MTITPFFEVPAFEAKFLAAPGDISYHMANGGANAFVGEDDVKYIGFPIGSNAEFYVGDIIAQTYTNYTDTEFQALLGSVALSVSGAITPVWVVFVPGKNKIFWIGVDRSGLSSPTEQQVVILRCKIDNTGALVLDDLGMGDNGATLLCVEDRFSRPYYGVGGGGPWGKAVSLDETNCYVAFYVSTGFPGLGLYNTCAIIRFPLTGSQNSPTPGTWASVCGVWETPEDFVFHNLVGVGGSENKITIWEKLDGSLGLLSYIDTITSNGNSLGGVKIRYINLNLSSTNADTRSSPPPYANIASSFPEIIADAGLNFADAVSGNAQDDFGAPIYIDGLLVWARGFSDAMHTGRIVEYDAETFALVTAPFDFEAITQSIVGSVPNQLQIGVFAAAPRQLMVTLDSTQHIYIQVFGPIPLIGGTNFFLDHEATRARVIGYQLPKKPINSVLEIGPFRYEEQKQADETSDISSLIIALSEQGGAVVLFINWNNDDTGDENWNDIGASEDVYENWGDGFGIPDNFKLELRHCDDGVNSQFQGDETLTPIEEFGASKQYASEGVSAIFHILRFSALELGQKFALKVINIAGQLTGRHR